MYNLSLPNLCAVRSSLWALRLPTVDLHWRDAHWQMLNAECAPTLYCVVLYIAACVDAIRMVLLGPFSPPLAGESFDTHSKAAKLVLVHTQVFLTG